MTSMFFSLHQEKRDPRGLRVGFRVKPGLSTPLNHNQALGVILDEVGWIRGKKASPKNLFGTLDEGGQGLRPKRPIPQDPGCRRQQLRNCFCVWIDL